MSTAAANKSETRAAIALMAAVVLAMVLANSPVSGGYSNLLLREVAIGLPPLVLTKSVLHWINDGLMAIFFLLVGLEIKREALTGGLASLSRAALPAIGAFGGVLVPALLYLWCTRADAGLKGGWPIPTATDIAFALGVLALLGPRVSPSLRVFLLALAVIDDLAAIVLIALLFTEKLSWLALVSALLCLALLLTLNRTRVRRLWPYLLTGFVLWLSVLKSGVHATLAGVVLGLAIPVAPDDDRAVATRLEHGLQPWVAFAILPLFALANAGVPLDELNAAVFTHPVTVGIALGLLLGKLVGVLGFTWLAVHFGFARLPPDVDWRQMFGIALLTGIGFTMSLFLGSLAFTQDDLHGEIRVGVLLGSTCAAIGGAWWLRTATRGS